MIPINRSNDTSQQSLMDSKPINIPVLQTVKLVHKDRGWEKIMA